MARRRADWRIPGESVQPASVDLRLGEHAWALRCSFLPDSDSTVEEKVEDLAFDGSTCATAPRSSATAPTWYR